MLVLPHNNSIDVNVNVKQVSRVLPIRGRGLAANLPRHFLLEIGTEMAGRPKGLPKTGGRKAGAPNRVTADIKALAQTYGPEAVDTLAEIMRDGSHPPAARVAAAKELIDRGFGKAVQPTELSGKDGMPFAYEFIVKRAGTEPRSA